MTQVQPYNARWFSKSSIEEATIYSESYPVPLRDGSVLQLPLRALPGGEMAIALLMSNQTSFAVEHEIIRLLTDLVHDLAPEAIVGVPTMGLAYARPVAQNIGLDDYVALGLRANSGTMKNFLSHWFLQPAHFTTSGFILTRRL